MLKLRNQKSYLEQSNHATGFPTHVRVPIERWSEFQTLKHNGVISEVTYSVPLTEGGQHQGIAADVSVTSAEI